MTLDLADLEPNHTERSLRRTVTVIHDLANLLEGTAQRMRQEDTEARALATTLLLVVDKMNELVRDSGVEI